MNAKISTVGFVLIMFFQNSQAQNCVRGISTNPQNPVNHELDALYPGKTNPWVNYFDFGAYQNATFDPIYLNPTAGWQVDDWTNLTQIPMNSPYTLGGAAGGSYLVTPAIPFQNRDFHWEDGWELLYLGTGYYPNGERIDTVNTNRIISQAFPPKNPRVPYMIYYNRYSAKIRLFVGLFADFGDFQSASVDLAISGDSTSTNPTTGILRHLSNYDTPLDQHTQTTLQSGVNSVGTTQSSNNIFTWYTFDFQVGYDPCTCHSLTNLDFIFRAVESSDISLYGRQITLDEDLTDANGNPIYDDGFLSVQDINSNAESGYIFRDKLSNLVEDYNTSLDTYNQQMEDKQFGKLGWFRDVLDDVREQAIGAAVDFVPGGQIASFLVDKNLNLGADSSNITDAVNNGGKAVLGQGYDFLSNQILVKM